MAFFHHPIKAYGLVLLMMLSACSTSTGPVKIRDAESVTSSDAAQLAKVQPVVPEQRKENAIPIVEKYIDQANTALGIQQVDKAIELAERGLRINRKEPRLYLILAKAYAGKTNTKQSSYFARQGLRYTNKSELIYPSLLRFSR